MQWALIGMKFVQRISFHTGSVINGNVHSLKSAGVKVKLYDFISIVHVIPQLLKFRFIKYVLAMQRGRKIADEETNYQN